MEYNVYAPPAAMVMDAPRANAPEFYVVSRTKFLVLFFVTMGAYQLYWFYKHWARYRAYRREDLWPVARAIFPVFFTHSLSGEIDQSLARADTQHRWSPEALATGYVIFAVAGSLCDRLAANEIGSPTTDIIGLLSLLPIGYCLWRIQDAANRACGQPHGESNRGFTWANGLWIVLGILLWGLMVLGLAMIFGLVPE